MATATRDVSDVATLAERHTVAERSAFFVGNKSKVGSRRELQGLQQFNCGHVILPCSTNTCSLS
jgi:hypothetical protein